MIDFNESETKKNLIKAFIEESITRNKYNFFSTTALNENLKIVSNIFNEISENEKLHAQIFYDLLIKNKCKSEIKNVNVDILLGYSTTLENLKFASKNEFDKWSNKYILFSEKAKEEGFIEIGDIFRKVASVEKYHEKKFLSLYESLKENNVSISDKSTLWQCINCGYIFETNIVPNKCPLCNNLKDGIEKIT